MPRRAPSPCREARCAALVDSKVGYCKQHIRAHEAQAKAKAKHRHRKYNKVRSSDDKEKGLNRFYGTASWKKLRNAYIAKVPLCQHCTLRGKVTEGAMVDHIIERRDGGESLDMSNLQTLCFRCHAYKTAEERNKR